MDHDALIDSKEQFRDHEGLVNNTRDVNEPEFKVEIDVKPCIEVKMESPWEVIKSEELIEDVKFKMPLHEEVFIKDEVGEFSNGVKEIKEEVNVNEISKFDEFEGENVELSSTSVREIKAEDEIVTSDSFQCIFCAMRFSNQESMLKHMKKRWCTKKIFECRKCKRKFATRARTQNHLKNCITCQVCQKPFINVKVLNRHLKTHEKYLKCELCEKLFTGHNQFTLHKKICEKVEYECNKCKMRFKTIKLIESHMKTHAKPMKEIVLERFECEICQRKFRRKHTFENHMTLHNNERPLLSCSICQQKFFYGSVLNLHMQRHLQKKSISNTFARKNLFKAPSTTITQFECGICQRRFLHEKTLTLHMTIHHELVSLFECHICKEKFKRQFNLDLHLQLHAKETSLPCKICPKIFMSKSALSLHMHIHTTDAPVECEICHKKFKLKTYLRRHMITHDKDRALLECNICKMKFKRGYELRRHKKVKHFGQSFPKKPFECKICQKQWVTKQNFVCHMQVHAGTLKLRECNQCDMKFRFKLNLNRHIRKRHAEEKKAV